MQVLRGRRWPDGAAVECEVADGVILHLRELAPDPSLPWILPGFIDNHCHILPTGLDMQKVPLGDLDTPEAILDRLRDRLTRVEPGSWLLAVHYDQTKFPTGAHLTRAELDLISLTVPILLRHVNGHASIANSAALQLADVAPDQPDPKGGSYGRDESGIVNGVLFEEAHERVTACVPNPTVREMTDAILAAAHSMAGYGIRTATDMMTGRYNLLDELMAYRMASEEGSPVRFRMYVQWKTMFGPRAIDMARIQEQISSMNPARCRVAGVKIFADGAIGSRTAAIYGQYEGDAGEGDAGQLIYSAEKLTDMITTAAGAGYQLAVHTIGNRSTDLVMDAYAQTSNPSRHRIEHAMLLSDSQIERIHGLGCPVTMQPEFLYRFGHSYQRNLGPERSFSLKRMRSVSEAGIPLSLSSDRPIVSGDPAIGIRSATGRPEGFDPAENLTLEQAFRGYTTLAAAANEDFGWASLTRLSLADPVLWDVLPWES